MANLQGRWLWLWRAAIVAILVWNVLTGMWALAVVVAVLWIGAELLRRRNTAP